MICHKRMNYTKEIKKIPVLENSLKILCFNLHTTNINNIELVSQEA
jgi:hypothetical protein